MLCKTSVVMEGSSALGLPEGTDMVIYRHRYDETEVYIDTQTPVNT